MNHWEIDLEIIQIKVGLDNFSYIIFDKRTIKAAVIDPSIDIRKTVDFLKSKNLNLKYIFNTHNHSDHIRKNKDLKELYPNSKIVASEKSYRCFRKNIDVKVNDKSEIKVGNVKLNFLLTPGHSPDGLSIIADNKAIFTGDTLFIDDCGRADLLGGNIKDLYLSLQKIKKLSLDLIVYPGHDYASKPFDTLKNQIKTNKTLLAKNLDEFKKIE